MEEHERLATIETILKQQTKTLDAILTQATKTNGRVSDLELWKAGLMGKISGIVIVVSALVWVIGNFFNK